MLISRIFQVLIILYLISNCNCYQEAFPCPECASPAFGITMIDSSGNKTGGFTIKLTDKSNTVTIVDDTSHNASFRESSYSIYIRSGTYQIEITKSGYDTIRLNNISTTENRCGGSNTRDFTIKPESAGLSKSRSAKFQIVKDTTIPGCGS